MTVALEQSRRYTFVLVCSVASFDNQKPPQTLQATLPRILHRVVSAKAPTSSFFVTFHATRPSCLPADLIHYMECTCLSEDIRTLAAYLCCVLFFKFFTSIFLTSFCVCTHISHTYLVSIASFCISQYGVCPANNILVPYHKLS